MAKHRRYHYGDDELPQEFQDLYRRVGRILDRNYGDPRMVPVQSVPTISAPGTGKIATQGLMWGPLPEEDGVAKDPWKAYGASKDVTDKVREKGGIPDPPKDDGPEWFSALSPSVKSFLQEVVDAATVEAARRVSEQAKKKPESTEEPGENKHPFSNATRASYDSATGKIRYYGSNGLFMGERDRDAPQEPAAAPASDPLAEALHDLFQAGKKLFKAFVNEVLE